MGSKNIKAWIEAILFGLISFALTYATIPVGDYAIVLAVLPLVFFSLRRGLLLGIVASMVTGIVHFFVNAGGSDMILDIVTFAAPFLFIGVSGFFAKFTQRTLNNKRFSNAALNIVTASFFGTLIYFVWKLVAAVFFYETATSGNVSVISDPLMQNGTSFLMTFVVVFVVLLLVAKVTPKFYIPGDSRFLSRKEKSKLLND